MFQLLTKMPLQVFVAAFTKRKQICPSNSEVYHLGVAGTSPNVYNLRHTDKFRF